MPPSHLKVYERKTSLCLRTAAWPLASSYTLFIEPTLEGRVKAPLPWNLERNLSLEPLTSPPDLAEGRSQRILVTPIPSHWPLKAEKLSEPGVGRCDLEERLDLKMEEGAMSKGMQAPLGAGKGKKAPQSSQHEPALPTA